MAANGLTTSQYACKCLNIRIHQLPTNDTPPLVEAGFRSLRVAEQGIRVAHTEVTLRSRSKPIPVSGSSTGELTRYTTVVCLVCNNPTYRVAQQVTPDLGTEEGPLLPTDDWVEKELCKSTTGWIEVYQGCLTGEEISEAEASPMYSKHLRLVLPGGSPPTTASQLSEDDPSPVPNVRGPSEHGKTHLPDLPSIFLPPPFSPSHVVFSHLAAVASELSQKLRDEAEEYVAQVTERKVAELLQEEIALKQEVTLVWNRFRKSLRLYEEGEAAGKQSGLGRRRSVSGHARSTSNPSTRTAAQTLSSSVRINNFVPSGSLSTTRVSPSRPTESALSASIKISGFHYPESQRQTNGNGNASPSVDSLDLPPSGREHSTSTKSSTRVPSPSPSSSTRTAAMNIDPETSIREAHRREIDESKDLATSYLVMHLEAQMEQRKLAAAEAAISPPPPVPSGSQPAAEITSTTAVRGQSPRVHRSAIKQRSKSPKEGPQTEDQKDGTGKGKRKVTFDVQPEVAIINTPGSDLPTPPDSNQGEDVIFDMDNESEYSMDVRVEVPTMEQAKKPQLANTERARSPPRSSLNRSSNAGLPPQLSSLRPTSLPAPSAMRPPQRHPISPTNEAAERSRALRESLGASDAQRRTDVTSNPVEIRPAQNGTGSSPADPREEELLRLVAASTPSHRSAWKKNSKAWQVFLSRRERRTGELGPEPIAEEGSYVLDDFNPQARRRFNGTSDSDGTDEEDDDGDLNHPIAQSLPIPIGPLRSFGIPSYQPKTSLSDRPGALVPPLASGRSSRAERDYARSADPGVLDFVVDTGSPYEDDVESDPENGGKARQRALKILKARNEMPAAGMWRSLA